MMLAGAVPAMRALPNWNSTSLIRLSKAASINASSAMGFSTWSWNPALRTLARCSGPVKAVRAAAGVIPPRSGGSRPNLGDQPVAALPRHRKVAQEDVGALPLQRGECLLGGTDRGDLGAILREDVGYGLPHVARVVHDQHPDAIEARALIEPSCGTRHVSPPGRHSRG